jgi:hypothetical protein
MVVRTRWRLTPPAPQASQESASVVRPNAQITENSATAPGPSVRSDARRRSTPPWNRVPTTFASCLGPGSTTVNRSNV